MTLETTNRVRSQATVINGDADDTKNTDANDTQMRHKSILLFGQHSRLCRNGREQVQREGSAGHGGDAAAGFSSASS